MIRRFGPVLAAGAACALLLAGSASAAATNHHSKRFASCSARGGNATCVASGTTYHPLRIFVHVRAQPRQRVTGSWTVVCSKGLGSGSKKGSFDSRAWPTLTRKLRMNYRHPDMCVVTADAQLSRSGNTIHVWLTRVK